MAESTQLPGFSVQAFGNDSSEPIASEENKEVQQRRKANTNLIYMLNFFHMMMLTVVLGPVFDLHMFWLSSGAQHLGEVGVTNVSLETVLVPKSDLTSKPEFVLTFSAKLNSNITNGSLLSLSASPKFLRFGNPHASVGICQNRHFQTSPNET